LGTTSWAFLNYAHRRSLSFFLSFIKTRTAHRGSPAMKGHGQKSPAFRKSVRACARTNWPTNASTTGHAPACHRLLSLSAGCTPCQSGWHGMLSGDVSLATHDCFAALSAYHYCDTVLCECSEWTHVYMSQSENNEI
jgi:hypothetical protein